ncbi:MAG: dephospho-CoA kinase [Propionibacteriaceae bacterium]|jgi:dephospho-CoA kinase|nr:dephospho-CoA kinase [Propionibacteriaceae bacterium]
MRKRRVALAGGIASGKSLIAQRFEQLGAVLVDYDTLARQVVEPGTPGLEVLAQVFGTGILRPDGTLDREELGELVFDDDSVRKNLNSLLHPLVWGAAKAADAAAPDDAVVVHVIPLLVETDSAHSFDKVVVVDTPIEMQIARLMSRNGYNRMQAKKRIAAQASREARLAVADYVIDNSGTIPETLAQAESIWDQIKTS